MIDTHLPEPCPYCQKHTLTCNGHTPAGKQKYECSLCHRYGTLHPTQSYSDAQKEQIVAATQERMSLCGVERVFGVCRQTVAAWVKKNRAASPVESNAGSPEEGGCLRMRRTVVLRRKKDQSSLDLAGIVPTNKTGGFLCGGQSRRTRSLASARGHSTFV